MSGTSNVVILGTRKGLLTVEHGTDGWRVAEEAFPGIPVTYAAVDPRTGVWWAGVGHGHWGPKLHRSQDGGATWEEVPAPRYPEGAERSPGEPAALTYLWVVAPGGADQPERLYIGTEPGGLFRSDDGGATFDLVEGLWNHPSRPEGWFGGGRDYPGLHSVLVDPRDSRRVLVGVSVAGVFETTDDGATWQPRNQGLHAPYLPDPQAEVGHDPHLIAAAPANFDVLWQQNHAGIFRSTDSAQSWQEVSQADGPAVFGFPIAVDAAYPDTAWVVPAVSDERRMAIDGSLCVCRTQDGGQTWTELRAGLPQSSAYDVTYRHALDISGDRLAFGTTTGNVYASDDRGDTWHTVGNNFPPVYSVRFAPPTG